ncbi:MAG TPA: ATP-binding cassette domain-containing protein [Actinoplanes sp.]|nr:ATP-binding cassette domain-containing protein [Actinoplanes sp.]
MSSADAIRIEGLTHSYGDTTALGPIDLTVPEGEFLVLVGASGCGKSTLLRLIAGFEQPDEPFAALDALTREKLQDDLRQVSASTGRTSVFVTHSVDEAVFLGSRVVVLTPRPGQVALDLPIGLPRTGITADDLRALPQFATLRAEVGHAIRDRVTV